MFGSLISTPRPFFYASLDGIATGRVLMSCSDPLRFESFLLGQGRSSAGVASYDVWALLTMRPGTAGAPLDFHAPRYSIDTSILADHSLDATATITIHAANAGDRLVHFRSFPRPECRQLSLRGKWPSPRILPESGHDPTESSRP